MQAAAQKIVNRPSSATLPAAPVHIRSLPGVAQASSLKISSPADAAEREATQTARRILHMPLPQPGGAVTAKCSPHAARFAGTIRQREPVRLARKQEGSAMTSPGAASEIGAGQSSGEPLPPSVRQFMEPRFNANFGGVRIHTGEQAAGLNRQVSAQAFTVGNQIYFGRGRFQPESSEGRELIAHELTHTIQQGAVSQGGMVQRSIDATVAEHSNPQVQRRDNGNALNYFAERACNIPGFRMLTIMLGVNPINMSRVERSAASILRAVVEFLPGGALITQALDNYGVFDRAGAWIERQIRSLNMTSGVIRNAIDRFLDSLGWGDLFHLGSVWERAKRIFTEPIDRIVSFARPVASGIIRFIKDAILMPLARLASNTRGWDLLCAVLGRNPITGEAVPRTAESLIGGFMKLIGQEEVWENIKRGNAIARAWAWFQGALEGVLGFVRQIPPLFVQTLRSLEIADIVLLPRAFAKIAGMFGNFALRFFAWAGEQVWTLLQIIFEVVAPQVMVYLRRAGNALRTIIRDPIRFIGNLVRAGIQGLRQFAANFLTHLRASLIGWLTGAMAGANIYIPQGMGLMEIVKFVLSVLGLTWQNIRAKLARAIGETAVATLETGFDIVVTLVREGPAAAWQKILESLGNLREMVMEQVMGFVQTAIVQRAITTLLTSLSPVGGFIQAIIAIYNTVMFFVERLRQIAQVAASVIDSIAAIAAGNISAAANRVEQTMTGLLTLVISFLARIAGLGRVSDAVVNVINRLRQPIDRALDRVVEWIVEQARRVGRTIAGAAGRAVSWWRNRRSFTSIDGHSHSLYFNGEGRAARVTLASNPMPVEDFLNGIQGRADYQTPPKRQLIAQARQQINAIQAAQALPETQGAQAEQRINAAFTAMRPLLVQLVDGGDFATEDHPLPMTYPKRRWSAYPVIYIGPRAEKRVAQADLASRNLSNIQAALSQTEQAEWMRRGNVILACRPNATITLPTGTTVGISAPYRVEPGKKIRLVPRTTRGGGLINEAFRPFGYRALSEGFDGDHIVEMQLGGPNILENLWPLQAGENRSSGSTIASMTFTKPDGSQISMDTLKARAKRGTDVWFIVVRNL